MRAILNVKRLRLLSVGFTNFNFKKISAEVRIDDYDTMHALYESCSSWEKLQSTLYIIGRCV